MEKNIKNQTFDGMRFIGERINCGFQNVVFVNCTFSQKITNCFFRNCKFLNCKMYDSLFCENTLIDCCIDNILITNNSYVRENKFIRTQINQFIVVALGLCYNEYLDCIINDISDLIVLRRDNTVFPNFDGTVISITNDTFHNCLIDFKSVIKLAKCNLRKIMMGGSRMKPSKSYPLYKYIDGDNQYEAEWDLSVLNFEERIYYIIALTIFLANIYIDTNDKRIDYDSTLKFVRTNFSNEIKFVMDDKYLDTTLVEPIISSINNCNKILAPLIKEVPNLLDEKYWKPFKKENSLTLKKSIRQI